LTWPRIAARFAFWRAEPPLSVLLQYPAAFLGWEPPSAPVSGENVEQMLLELFPSGKL
jgi:hypothetical protein